MATARIVLSESSSMHETDFRRIVEKELVPMLGAKLAAETLPSTSRDQVTSYAQPGRLMVKPSRSAQFKVAIDRIEGFSRPERVLAEQFVRELAVVSDINAGDYESDLWQAVPRRLIARHLGGGNVLSRILDQLEQWSYRTYEGQRIVAAIGLDSENGQNEMPIEEYWEQGFAPVFTNGVDTLLVCGRDGAISGFVQLSSDIVPANAPYRLRQIALWAEGKRIAVVLNRHGEILVFNEKVLRFAKRRGHWFHYTHEAIIRRMSPPLYRPLREALYESCLDVSFARTGGCIGVLARDKLTQLSSFVSGDDIIADRTSYKARLLSTFSDKGFYKLDRRLRQELLSMDGSVVLDHQGRIVAAGAIIEVPAGSEGGGGRLAAARKLSMAGLGINISEDGSIVGLREGQQVFHV